MLACQKEHFSLPPELHYLNCAYMSPASRRVEEAGIAGVRRKRDPTLLTPRDFFEESDRVRALFARLIHAADPSRVAIVPAASYGIATAARNTPVRRGQNIVILHEQFPSNVYAWRALARDGAELRTIEPPEGAVRRGEEWNARILEAIDPATAIVAVPHVHWTDGTRFDLERIGERAREVGAALIVDGTQSVGALDFDVRRIRPDALVCPSYKWLMGPYSLGVAYFGPRYDDGVPLEETWIGREGSEDFRGLVAYRDAYRPGAARYDVGEQSNFALMPMLRAALEQLLEWGVPEIEAYCRALTRDLVAEARDLGFGVEDEAWRAAHLFGLRTPAGTEIAPIADRLQERDVIVSVRGGSLRVSPHVYNDTADIEALRDVLRAARPAAGRGTPGSGIADTAGVAPGTAAPATPTINGG